MEKKLFLAVVLFGLSFVLGLTLCLPKFQEMRYAQKQLRAKEAEIEEKKAYFEEIDALSKKLEQYPEELAIIDFGIPDKFSLPFLFDFFEKIVLKNGLFLRSIKLVDSSMYASRTGRGAAYKEPHLEATPKESAKNQLKEAKIAISLSGSYSAFKNLIYSMEKTARLNNVEKISFSLPQDEASAIIFNITTETYSY